MERPTVNWVGHTMGKRYKIESVLGQGGMSAVYKAYDPNLQRPVAVKLIHAHLSRDPEFMRRFEQEAAAVAKLRHPHIIQVYDFDHDDDIYYMVLDYIPGKTLKDWLKTLNRTKRRLPLADAVRIMTAVCDAVAYAHEHNIIHRDLKPANIMLTPKGQPILMDFGITKMLDGTEHTATGTILGTAKYMSPEQARGERPDARTDIYALGVMLYELVAGHTPFAGDTTVAVLMKHINEPVPDIRQIQRDVPDELVEIIKTALAKDPKERYQSAAHMSAALKLLKRLSQTAAPAVGTRSTVQSRIRSAAAPIEAGADEPAPPSPATLPAPSARLKKRLLWLMGAGAAVLLIVLGIGAFFVLNRLLFNTDQAAEALSTERDLPPSTGMTRIAGNVYTVGLDGPDSDHIPAQAVELSEFWIDQYEVTNAQYAEFLAATDRQPPAAWAGGEMPADQAEHPVKGITWDMAVAYCEWANKRLPAEAEWEVAARGEAGRLYPWGDNRAAVELPRSGTYAVGAKVTNQSPFGVFDMAGNVWEWVGEPYAPVAEGNRVLRGGANDFLKDMAFRLQGAPALPTMVASAGIRCAADEVNVIETEGIADSSVLYQENFANPGSGWPILSEGDLFFGYHPPDYYHFEVGKPDSRAVISHAPNFSNITVETEVLVDHTDTPGGDFRYGLVLRRTNPNDYYAFTVSPRQGRWYILKSSAAGLETLVEGQVDTLRGFAPPGFTPDKTDTLRVDANGPNFVFRINGQAVAEISDFEYVNGEVGFYDENVDETLSHIHFDSLTIRAVEIDQSQVARTEEVLYQDSFVDPNSGWPILAEDTRLFGYHPPDFYHVESSSTDNLAIISRQPDFEDVTVESDILVDHTDTPDGDFRYGLVLRRTGDDQYYAFTVSSRQGSWQVLKRTPAGLETLAEGQVDTLRGFAPAGFTPDKTDLFRVEAQGPDFVFTINGQEMAEVSDPDYASGEIGFFVETLDETLAHVHYDSLTIR